MSLNVRDVLALEELKHVRGKLITLQYFILPFCNKH